MWGNSVFFFCHRSVESSEQTSPLSSPSETPSQRYETPLVPLLSPRQRPRRGRGRPRRLPTRWVQNTFNIPAVATPRVGLFDLEYETDSLRDVCLVFSSLPVVPPPRC